MQSAIAIIEVGLSTYGVGEHVGVYHLPPRGRGKEWLLRSLERTRGTIGRSHADGLFAERSIVGTEIEEILPLAVNPFLFDARRPGVACRPGSVTTCSKVEDGALGHVNFRNHGNIIMVAIQNIFVSSAPMFVGAAVVIGCGLWLSVLPAGYIWLKIIIWYLMISMFFHMTMSPADIKVYIKGVPLFIVILFLIAVPLRLTGVI